MSDVLERAGRRRPTAAAFDELAGAFSDLFVSLRQSRTPINVGLTGGKDSRLIAAGLKAASVPFRSYIVDYGAANAADVAASSEVARRLGVEHTVRKRQAESGVSSSAQRVDPLRTVRDTLFVTDGMLSGYETVPRRSRDSPQINVAGNGGELLRGGYVKASRRWTREEARTYLVDMFGRFSATFRSGLADAYQDFLATWVDRQPGHLSGPGLLDRFYLFYRCGRWSAAARTAYSAFQDCRQPFFDARLIAQVQALRIEARVGDRLNYELLRRLAPELIDLPFANKHWLFASSQQQADERAAFPEFYQVPGSACAGRTNFDWRTRFRTQLRGEFERQIFAGPAAEALFEVLDRNGVRKVFDSPDATDPYNKLFLFAVYTLSVLLSNEWLGPPAEGRVATVDPGAP